MAADLEAVCLKKAERWSPAMSLSATKNTRLKTEYMDTCSLGARGYLPGPDGGLLFEIRRSGESEGPPIKKSDIATGDMVLQVTLTQKSFGEVPNILMCREKRMLVVVESW